MNSKFCLSNDFYVDANTPATFIFVSNDATNRFARAMGFYFKARDVHVPSVHSG